MKELLKKLLTSSFEGKENISEQEIDTAVETLTKSGKLVPEEKYLQIKKDLEAKDATIVDLNAKVSKFKDVNLEDLQKAKTELETMQTKIKEDAETANKAKLEKDKEAQQAKATTAIEAMLKENGAIDATLVTSKVIKKAGGLDKLEFNEEGKLITDIDFAINAVKSAHPTNFSTSSAGGGASAGGDGGNKTEWTNETAMEAMKDMSDQEIVDKSKSDESFAKSIGQEALFQG